MLKRKRRRFDDALAAASTERRNRSFIKAKGLATKYLKENRDVLDGVLL